MITIGSFVRSFRKAPILTCVACVLIVVMVALYVEMTLAHGNHLSDFNQDYASARLLLNGARLYGREQIDFMSAQTNGQLGNNFHPPFSALIFTPIALLSYENAYVLYQLLLVLLAAYLIVAAIRQAQVPAPYALILVALGFCWYPTYVGIVMGNTNVLVAALITYALSQAKLQRRGIAGAALAVAAMLKLYPLLFLVTFLVRRHKGLLGAFLSFCVLGALITFVVVPWQDWQTFRYLAASNVNYGGFPSGSVSLNGLVAPLVYPNKYVAAWVLPQWISALMLRLPPVVLVILFIKALLRARVSLAFDFSITCAAMTLLSPLMWEHALLVCLMPAAYVLPHLKRRYALLLLLALSIPSPLLYLLYSKCFDVRLVPALVSVVLRWNTFAVITLFLMLYRMSSGSEVASPDPERETCSSMS